MWTTDAPYRETAQQLNRHAKDGILAVEMQAASLFAFAQAYGVSIGIVAQLTNATDQPVGQTPGQTNDQFDKGKEEDAFALLLATVRAGYRYLEQAAQFT